MTVIDFATRKAAGDEHERKIRDALELRGWTIHDNGVEHLHERIKQQIVRSHCPMRWSTDFLAANDDEILMVEGKTDMHGGTGGWFRIDRKSIEAQRRWQTMLDIPVVYVLGNMNVATLDEVLNVCKISRIERAAAYLAFPAERARPMDDIFGEPLHQWWEAA